MKRIATLCLLVLFAACADSPVVPEASVNPLGTASGGGGANKVMICHWDGEFAEPDDDGPGWELSEVNSKAFQKHLAHGDGVPGGVVPGGSGDTFDDQCNVIPAPAPECPCTAQPGWSAKVAQLTASAQYNGKFFPDTYVLLAGSTEGSAAVAYNAPPTGTFCQWADAGSPTNTQIFQTTLQQFQTCQAVMQRQP